MTQQPSLQYTVWLLLTMPSAAASFKAAITMAALFSSTSSDEDLRNSASATGKEYATDGDATPGGWLSSEM